jgi:hypothetical protein
MKVNRTFLAAIAMVAMLAVDAKAVFVRTPPPAPRSTVVIGRAPRPGFVWTPGYYRWGSVHGARMGYVWVPGIWARPPRPGAVWVPPVWRSGSGGWTFVAGRWR